MSSDLARAVDRLLAAVTDAEEQVRVAFASDALDPRPTEWTGLPPSSSEAAAWVADNDPAYDLPNPTIGATMERVTKASPAKPGWQTTEWWATVLVAVGGIAAAQQDALPPRFAAIATAVSVSAYAFSRAIAKL